MTDRLPRIALCAYVESLFRAVGLSAGDSAFVAESLVEADRMGIHSHGVALLDMYLARIAAGSVRAEVMPEAISDTGSAIVLDGAHGVGAIVAREAMRMAVERAAVHGSGIVAVRHGFHFGTARQFALSAAESGCIGIAMCNTRPLMPAPGGAERVVGNNPLAIAVPVDEAAPLVLDMATSEAAMGRIRVAERAGQSIPATWATNAQGGPTTNASDAIAGMLLPAGGPKGFGLALMIDLMCGLLSGGSLSRQVQPLYGSDGAPYDCSFLFIAIDLGHFGDPAEMRARAGEVVRAIRQGARAPGVDRLFVPGEPEWARAQMAGDWVVLPDGVARMLAAEGEERGVMIPEFLSKSSREEV